MNLYFIYKSILKLERNTVLNSEYKFKTLAILVLGLETMQNLVNSRCCFGEHGKEMNHARILTHVHSHCSVHCLLFRDDPVAVGVVVFLNSLICDTPVVGFYIFCTKPMLGQQKNVNYFSDERKRRFNQAADIFNL